MEKLRFGIPSSHSETAPSCFIDGRGVPSAGPRHIKPRIPRKTDTFQEDIMAHTLPPLPYANNALEPSIDAMTMEIHHDRHHKAYVDNLNKALDGQAGLSSKPIEQL